MREPKATRPSPAFLQKNLRKVRGLMGKTQDEMAESLGLLRGNYVMYETGRNIPSLETIRELLRLSGLTFEELIFTDLSERTSLPGVRDTAMSSVSEDTPIYIVGKSLSERLEILERRVLALERAAK